MKEWGDLRMHASPSGVTQLACATCACGVDPHMGVVPTRGGGRFRSCGT